MRGELVDMHPEYITCTACSTPLVILRERDRFTSQDYSTYKPQALSRCRCGLLAMLVDSHGRPTVYSDTPHLVTLTAPGPTTGYPYLSSRTLAEVPHFPVPYSLFNYRPSPNSRPHLKAHRCYIKIASTLQKQRALSLPMPTLDNQSYNYLLRCYAYHHKIVIFTRRFTFLPTGQVLLPSDPFPDVSTLELRYYSKADLRQLHLPYGYAHFKKNFERDPEYALRHLKVDLPPLPLHILRHYPLPHKRNIPCGNYLSIPTHRLTALLPPA